MKEPNEKITKVHFYVGQQFGNKVFNSVDRYKTVDGKGKPPECMEWHWHGVKIILNGAMRICAISTIQGIDCLEQNADKDRFETAQIANEIAEKRGPGRPRVNA